MSVAARKRARAACSMCCRRSSTSRAIRAGAVSRRPTAKIRFWSASSASPRSAATRDGRLPLGPDKVFATLKHFAGHGSHEGGINTAPALIAERLLRESSCRRSSGGQRSRRPTRVMPSYNEIDGVPSHVNRWLLNDVLRGEWGFRGAWSRTTTRSRSSMSRHHVARRPGDAAAPGARSRRRHRAADRDAYPTLVETVKDGGVPRRDDRRAVARVLRAKFLAGLFEHPFADADAAEARHDTPDASRARARRGAQVDRPAQERQGTAAAGSQRGQDARRDRPQRQGHPPRRLLERPAPHGVDVLAGITAQAGGRRPASPTRKACGSPRTTPTGTHDKVVLGDPAKNRARDPGGGRRRAPGRRDRPGHRRPTSQTQREGWAETHLGDRADLDLIEPAEELVDARGRARQADRRGADATAGRWLSRSVAARCRRSSKRGTPARKAAPRSARCSSATSTRRQAAGHRAARLGQLPVYYNRKPTSFRAAT